MENWKTKTLIIGALIGAVAGVIAGALVIQRAEETQSNPKLTAGDGVKVGLGVLALLRQVGDLGGRK
jgi:hypothetical protein